ncbi:MAG: hypothetical protein GY862_16015 [Gammaproteobacteria bacterium]|nr:hypothetical protein [Gammaproteobacteria bacterium]
MRTYRKLLIDNLGNPIGVIHAKKGSQGGTIEYVRIRTGGKVSTITGIAAISNSRQTIIDEMLSAGMSEFDFMGREIVPPKKRKRRKPAR